MGDRDDVRRVIESGSEEAFCRLVERYQGRVLRLVSSVLGPAGRRDAEDVVQEVFLRVYRKLSRFRGDSSFSTWLYRVAYNTAIDHRRRYLRRETLFEVEVLEGMVSPGRTLPAAERLSVVQNVERLPEPYRTAIYLRYWYGASMAEIGELLGAKPNTVKTYLFRAKKRLGRTLQTRERP